ncbi:MAG: T9SS type A sorting domain-containing protein [Ignavibacteria bacterium]|nr:T9SS type A sorting domain-containing protein [Ignavibacteria bacterium]
MFRFGDPIGVTQNGTEIPSDYSLGQNYPNPFNPATNINFSLPRAGETSITVYDASGKLVENISSGYRLAGNYTVDFSAPNLSSGVYFYSLSAEGFKETKKMVLVK